MIQVYQSPPENSVMPDGNTTLIIIKSERGAGYYFRAKIYVDDTLFDEQSWSREDDFIAKKEFLSFYRAYFYPVFEPVMINGLVEQRHLIKKLKIIVHEIAIEDDAVVDTVTLPEYFIMYTNKPFYFDDTVPVTVLEEDHEVMLLPVNAKINIPFYCNLDNEQVVVKIINQNASPLASYATPVFSGKKVFLFQYNLSDLNLSDNDLALQILFEKGSVTLRREIKLFRFPTFPLKHIVFQTAFGYYKNAYFAGELSQEIGYTAQHYTNYQGQEITAEINTDISYTLNSGNLLLNEKQILNQVCTSLDIKIYQENTYIDVVTKTQKVLIQKDHKNLYGTDLKLTHKNKRVINNLLEKTMSFFNDFEISVNENELTAIDKNTILTHFIGNTPEKIKMTLPGQGTFKNKRLQDDVSIVQDQEYSLSEIMAFSFLSGLLATPGDGVTDMKIALFDGFWSNWATMTIRIIKVNLPGSHKPSPYFSDVKIQRLPYETVIYTFERLFFGNYVWHAKTDGTAYDHDFTTLWEPVGDVPNVTIENPTEIYPTVVISPNSPDFFQLKITTTCQGGSGSKIVSFNQTENTIKIFKTHEVGTVLGPTQGPVGGEVPYAIDLGIKITGGVPGTSIKISYVANYLLTGSQYTVYLDYNLPTQESFTYHGGREKIKTFNASGEIIVSSIRLYFRGWLAYNPYDFTISISNAEQGIIDPVFNQLQIAWV